ncbi:MAG: hypothetical protein DWQ01_05150 [Planctomycetota bacterium]|nr:MAG: hypothetical protein DWQ01_05150 [Planctomycetota bacterium]
MTVVGSNVPRLDGDLKVQGRAKYIDDLNFPGMLYGRTLRSTQASGKILSLKLELPDSEYVVVGAGDIPGKNRHALIQNDQPMLAWDRVQHPHEPIRLIAHRNREALWKVKWEVECAPSRPIFDPRKARKCFHEILIEKGSIHDGFAQSEVVLEREYRTGHQEQMYIEPQGVIAIPEKEGITIWGSLQCPYYVQKALCELLGLPPGKVRIRQAETGGGFGGKEEYPSIVAGHAALLALKAGKPVKMIYDREEDLTATTKRHPSIVRHKTGLDKDGRILAMDIEVILDGGAYATLSPVVLSRGVLHASGPYRCEHIRIRGRVVKTNTPPNGAFRGFGAPQTLFAAEAHADFLAESLNLDPVDFRFMNLLRPGDTMATGQRLDSDCSAEQVFREALERTDFRRRRKELQGSSRGLGLALFFHGAGFTGAGEVYLDSEVALEVSAEGVRVLSSSTEIGQGTRTVLAQIVAQASGVPLEQISIAAVDTAEVPDSGPTVASRTCMVVGGLLERCARRLKKKLNGLSPQAYFLKHGALRLHEKYQKPPEIQWDEQRYRGDAYGAYAWACNVIEIEVDPISFEIRPIKFTSVQDIGKAIHPTLAAGQVEGGSLQALGFALLEEVRMKDGEMQNANMTNYIIPTAMDVPEMETMFVDNPYRNGPFGAKGVGELPMDGAGPAIVNALRSMGLSFSELPVTPERVQEVQCISN